jgi:hypothetical protein
MSVRSTYLHILYGSSRELFDGSVVREQHAAAICKQTTEEEEEEEEAFHTLHVLLGKY